jgi:hypothetical protein
MAMNMLLEIIRTSEEEALSDESLHRVVKTSLVIRQSTGEPVGL